MAKSNEEEEILLEDFKPIQHIDLILVGKTGHGKSSTANSILGKDLFRPSCSVNSETIGIQYDISLFDNYALKVVDTPGIADTNSIQDPVKASESIMEQMKDAVILNPDGYHAFLLIFKFGVKYTKEELESIKLLKLIFGQDFIKNYCILILTGGDSFLKATRGQTLNDWLEDQKGEFKSLIKECKNRVILFNNVTSKESTKRNQIEALLSCIKNMNTGSRRYTNKEFDLAECSRQSLLEKSHVEVIGKELEEVELIINIFIRDILKTDFKKISSYINRIDVFIGRLTQNDDLSDIQEQFLQLLVDVNVALREVYRLNAKTAGLLAENEEKLRKEAGRLSCLLSDYANNGAEFKEAVMKEFKADMFIKQLISNETKYNSNIDEIRTNLYNELNTSLKNLKRIRGKCDDYFKSHTICIVC